MRVKEQSRSVLSWRTSMNWHWWKRSSCRLNGTAASKPFPSSANPEATPILLTWRPIDTAWFHTQEIASFLLSTIVPVSAGRRSAETTLISSFRAFRTKTSRQLQGLFVWNSTKSSRSPKTLRTRASYLCPSSLRQTSRDIVQLLIILPWVCISWTTSLNSWNALRRHNQGWSLRTASVPARASARARTKGLSATFQSQHNKTFRTSTNFQRGRNRSASESSATNSKEQTVACFTCSKLC